MFSLPYLGICIYCMLQLAFLLWMDNRRRTERSLQEQNFSVMLVILFFSFAADIISTIYPASGWLFFMVAAGNYIEIILNTLLLPIYFGYVCLQIASLDSRIKKRMQIILWALTALCSLVVISTAFTGKIFYFDQPGIYHRGSLFFLPMTILFIMMFLIEGFIMTQKSEIEYSYYRSLVLFLVFPLVGSLFQSFVFGLPFSLISATFAAQVVFTNIQNRNMDTDYLTGIFNRQALDHQMQSRIDAANSGRVFSAVLLDIDNFKTINDRFGHQEGDVALIRTAGILRSVTKGKEYVARYGGDEFCVISDRKDPESLEELVGNIRAGLGEFNETSKKPYKLSFSVGYAVYHMSMGGTSEQFLRIIDQNMYQEKNAHKAEERQE